MPYTEESVIVCTRFQIVVEGIAVVLHEIPMNVEHEVAVCDRAKDLIRRGSQGLGGGERLQNDSHETAARVIAGLCRWYMSSEECERSTDDVFDVALRIQQERLANELTADYFEWLDVASRVRGKKSKT